MRREIRIHCFREIAQGMMLRYVMAAWSEISFD